MNGEKTRIKDTAGMCRIGMAEMNGRGIWPYRKLTYPFLVVTVASGRLKSFCSSLLAWLVHLNQFV